MIHARQLCGEEEYDSDNTKLDEDEIDDSPTLRVSLATSNGCKPRDSAVPESEQERSSHNTRRKRPSSVVEDRLGKKKKTGEALAVNQDAVSRTPEGSKVIDDMAIATITPTLASNQQPGPLAVAYDAIACENRDNTSDTRQLRADDPSSLPHEATKATQPIPHEAGHDQTRGATGTSHGEKAPADNLELADAQAPGATDAGNDRSTNLISGAATDSSNAFINAASRDDGNNQKVMQQQQNQLTRQPNDDVLKAKRPDPNVMRDFLRETVRRLLNVDRVEDLNEDASEVVLEVSQSWKRMSGLNDCMRLSLMHLFVGFALSYLHIEDFDELRERWTSAIKKSSSIGRRNFEWEYGTNPSKIKDRIKYGLLQCYEENARQIHDQKTIDFLGTTLVEALDPIIQRSLRYGQHDSPKIITEKILRLVKIYYKHSLPHDEQSYNPWQGATRAILASAVIRQSKTGPEVAPELNQSHEFRKTHIEISNARQAAVSNDPAPPQAEEHMTVSAHRNNENDSASGRSGARTDSSKNGHSSANGQSEPAKNVGRKGLQKEIFDAAKGATNSIAGQCTRSEQGARSTEYDQHGESGSFDRTVEIGKCSDMESKQQPTKTASSEDEGSENIEQSNEDDQSVISDQIGEDDGEEDEAEDEGEDEVGNEAEDDEGEEEEPPEDTEYQEPHANVHKWLSEATDQPTYTSHSVPGDRIAERSMTPTPQQYRFCQDTFPSKNALFQHLGQIHLPRLNWKTAEQMQKRYSKTTKVSKPADAVDSTGGNKYLKKSDVRHSNGPLSISRDFQNPMIQQA